MTGHAGSSGLSLRDGLNLSGLTYPELWLLYVGVGGTAPSTELADEITRDQQSAVTLDAHEHNLIAQALNEHFLNHDQDHPVGYRDITDNVTDKDTGESAADITPL